MSPILIELKNKAYHAWQIGENWKDISDIIDRAYSQGYQNGLNNQAKLYDKGFADGLTKAKEVLKG